jgi:UDP-glucose 4-epimerase
LLLFPAGFESHMKHMNESFNFRQARIAITGGAGFVGSAIAKRLLIEGVPEVIILSRSGQLPPSLEHSGWSGRVKALSCDIRNRETLLKALIGCDAVFHQAALRVTQCAREPSLAYEIMVDGTSNVVAAATVLGIKKVVAASSAIVYGEAVTLPISESHPLQGTTLYGIAKIHNESLLRSFWKHFGLNYTALRYFNVYGPGMTLFGDDTEVLIRWLDRVDAGLPPLIFGDGRQTLDWVFVDDVVEANWRALLFPESGEVFNVCSGKETTLLDLLETLCQVLGKEISPEFRPVRSVNHVARRFGDPRKATELLQFQALTRLENGLGKLVEWRAEMMARRNVGVARPSRHHSPSMS